MPAATVYRHASQRASDGGILAASFGGTAKMRPVSRPLQFCARQTLADRSCYYPVMKLNYFVIAAGLTGIGLMALNATAQNSTQQVAPARMVQVGTPTIIPPSHGVVSTQTVVHVKPPAPSSAGGPLLNNVIAWDAELKEVTLKAGESEAHYTFNLTNVSPSDVKVTSVNPSCGCTVAQLASPLP